ncbi:MAG: hypothetical protein HON65_06675 [Rhodospirillales bacterium]|nr:hypothetical protein [Rhodospirillales bacterium]
MSMSAMKGVTSTDQCNALAKSVYGRFNMTRNRPGLFSDKQGCRVNKEVL